MGEGELRDELLGYEVALAARRPDDVSGGLMSLIDDAFVEFGRSGRIWTRASIRELLEGPPTDHVPIIGFEVALLSDDVALATYQAAGANRSSVWVRCDGTWKLRFHQGTPIPG